MSIGMIKGYQKSRDGILSEVTTKYCNESVQRLGLEGNATRDWTKELNQSGHEDGEHTLA